MQPEIGTHLDILYKFFKASNIESKWTTLESTNVRMFRNHVTLSKHCQQARLDLGFEDRQLVLYTIKNYSFTTPKLDSLVNHVASIYRIERL